MLDFKEIISPEDWELFARDFLQELGFFIESSPDRGPDGGKDLLISETLKGRVGQYKFNWLVSCKHNAVSNNSVNEAEEQNILERVAGFNADGFIGFYSTVPSSAIFLVIQGNSMASYATVGFPSIVKKFPAVL